MVALGRLNSKLGMLGDQAVSSISNLALTVLVAANTDVRAFARFALIYAAYSFALGAQRAFVGEPLILRVAGNASGVLDIRKSVAVCVLADVTVAAGFVVTWWISRSPEVLWAAAAVPLAMFQDALRFCNIARERYGLILASDSIWLVIIGIGAIFRSQLASASASPWLVLWGVGATVGATVLLRRDWPMFSGCLSWLRAEVKLSGAFLLDHLAASGLSQVVLFLLPVVSSLSVVAAVKVGTTAGASVLAVLQLAVSYSTLPSMTRAFNATGYRPAMHVAMRTIGGIACIGLVWAGLLLLVPDGVGADLFGRSWAQGAVLAPIFALQATAASFWLQGVYLMRVSGNAGRSVALRGIVSPIIVGVMIGGAKFYGGAGAAWGAVISSAFAAALWWWKLRSLARTAVLEKVAVKQTRPRPFPVHSSLSTEQRQTRRRPGPYIAQHRAAPERHRPLPPSRPRSPMPAGDDSRRTR